MNPGDSQPTPHRSFLLVATAYCLGVFNDNFFRQATIFLALDAGRPELRGVAAALFAVPFVLFAAPAGWLADRYPKRYIILGSKSMEVAAVLAGALGVLSQSWWLILGMVFLMGVQATALSPAVNGSIPELYPTPIVPKVNAFLKMGTTAAILLGITLAGGAMGHKDAGWLAVPWNRWTISLLMLAVAVVGWFTALAAPRRPPAAAVPPPFPWAGPWQTIRELRRLTHDALLFRIIWADGVIWFLGSMLMLLIVTFGRTELGLSEAVTSLMVFAVLVGIALGGWIGAVAAPGDRWTRVLAPSAFGFGLGCVFLPAAAAAPAAWRLVAVFALLGLTGMAGGAFMIPCESFIQVRPPPERKGTVIAVGNFVVFCGIVFSGLLVTVIDRLAPPSVLLAWLALPALLLCGWMGWARRGGRT